MNARTRRLRALAALSLLPLLAACSGTSSPSIPGHEMQLEVVSQMWNGWDPDYQADPQTTIIDAVVGESAEVPGLSGDMTIEITDVDNDSVTFRTSENMAPIDSNGAMDFDSLTSTFDLQLDETVTFGTPTMDGGMNYDVTFSPAN